MLHSVCSGELHLDPDPTIPTGVRRLDGCCLVLKSPVLSACSKAPTMLFLVPWRTKGSINAAQNDPLPV